MLMGLVCGIIAGTVLALVLRVDFFASPLWVVVALAVFVYAYLYPIYFFVALAFVAGMVAALFRTSIELTSQNLVNDLVSQRVKIVGMVADDPDVDENTMSLKLKNVVVESNNISGKIFVRLKSSKTIHRSDLITLNGKVSSGFGIYVGAVYQPEVLKIERSELGDVTLNLRKSFADEIRKYIPQNESQLGLAYLLGIKNGLDDHLLELLRVVGLTHIVVASGTHLSILVNVAKKIFGRISRFAGLLFSIILVVGFATMIGWTASITRAALVAIGSLLAWYVGRKWQPTRLLLIVMAMTLLIDPMNIINIGWLLSFGAFGGIMIISPAMTKYLYGETKPNIIMRTIIMTISATLMCLPIILYSFGSISLIALPANLIILPTIPYAMGLTFFTGAVSWWPWLAGVVGGLAKISLDFHIAVVDFLSEQKMFLFEMEPENSLVYVLYVPILIGILKIKQNIKIGRDSSTKHHWTFNRRYEITNIHGEIVEGEEISQRACNH